MTPDAPDPSELRKAITEAIEKHLQDNQIAAMPVHWTLVYAARTYDEDTDSMWTRLSVCPGDRDDPDYVTKGLLIDALDAVRASVGE